MPHTRPFLVLLIALLGPPVPTELTTPPPLTVAAGRAHCHLSPPSEPLPSVFSLSFLRLLCGFCFCFFVLWVLDKIIGQKKKENYLQQQGPNKIKHRTSSRPTGCSCPLHCPSRPSFTAGSVRASVRSSVNWLRGV